MERAGGGDDILAGVKEVVEGSFGTECRLSKVDCFWSSDESFLLLRDFFGLVREFIFEDDTLSFS